MGNHQNHPSYYDEGRDGAPQRSAAEHLRRAEQADDAETRAICAQNAIYHAERSFITGRLTAAGQRVVASAKRML